MRIPFEEVKAELYRLLMTRGCPEAHAEKVAHEMARNSLEGVYTHGINRFPRLMRNIDDGLIRLNAEPVTVSAFGALESMDGGMGLGVINAWAAMARAIALAQTHGVGMVALRNTNHWMRAATYGYQACDAGMAAICFTNTLPNMPTWGAVDPRLGNNPLVMAMPHSGGHVVLDMATSQFSYGALELAQLQGRQMPADAGFDIQGNLTRDPGAVIESRRILPTGAWKGAGLSLLLDLFAGCVSMGNTTLRVGRLPGDEHGLSQMFIAVHFHAIVPEDQADATVEETLANLRASKMDEHTRAIRWPGSRLAETREQNLREGIPVDDRVWATIRSLG